MSANTRLIPVADIKTVDLTCVNALKSTYVIQKRLPEVNICTAQPELSTEQYCKIARGIGRTMLAMQEISKPVPGIVEDTLEEDGKRHYNMVPFDIKPPHDPELKR